MAGKRALLAGALDRAGVLDAILRARARADFPWRWLTVLTFHRVAGPGSSGFDPETIDTTPEQFDRQVETMKRYFTLIDTRDLDEHRAGKPLPDNPAMITFDDGYRDNVDNALPILRKHGARATFFIASGFVTDRRLFWWERINYVMKHAPLARLRLAYPEEREHDLSTPEARRRSTRALLALVKAWQGLDLERFLGELGDAAQVPWARDAERAFADQLIMTWDDVRALADAGMDVQSHTHRHRVLQTLEPQALLEDLRASRQEIEAATGRPARALAYPAGRSIAEWSEVRLAVRRAGFRIGFSSHTGTSRLGEPLDWLDVPRQAMDLDMPEPFFRGFLAIPALAYP